MLRRDCYVVGLAKGENALASDHPDNRLHLSGTLGRRNRRWLRTRQALVEAFNHLVLDRQRGGKAIKVADIIAEAAVGRSTFYDHFRDTDELHMDALSVPFRPLADAAAGSGREEALAHILAHFWEHRAQARRTFSGRTGERAERLLASMVEQRLDGLELSLPARLAATMLARSALAAVKSWLSGEAWCEPAILARGLRQAGIAGVAALRADASA